MSCCVCRLIGFAALLSIGAGSTASELPSVAGYPEALDRMVAQARSRADPPDQCTQVDIEIKTYTPLSQCIVAGPERNVVIGSGRGCTNVMIDRNYIGADALGTIDIQAGGALYARDMTSTVEAASIIVGGTFQAGTEACPVGKLAPTNRFTVRLTGNKPPAAGIATGAEGHVHAQMTSLTCSDVPKGIGVLAGGALRLYGARGLAPASRDSSGIGPNPGSLSWTYLAKPAGPSKYQTSLAKIGAPVALGDQLQISVPLDVTKDWLKGDWIAVGTTSFSPYETEFVKISDAADAVTFSNTTKLSTIKLDPTTPLRNYHFGSPDPGRPGAANAAAGEATNYGVDERASVALVSRNITLTAKMVPWESTTSPDKDSLAWGGETRLCMGFKEAKFQGVELDRFGKDQLGSYPLHLHMAGDLTPTQFLFNSNSIHHSYNHCVTVHQTNNAKFSNNVCARVVGHLFYQEKMKDATPATNIQLTGISYTDNLGLGAMANGFKIAASAPTVPIDGRQVPKNWWEGDYFARAGEGYNGLDVPNTDDRSLAVIGSCFQLKANGELSGAVLPQADHSCPPGNPYYFEPPTGFWVINPATVMIGNSMGGCQSIGKAFWYLAPAGQNDRLQLKFQPVGKFINNRAHACYDGVFGETDTGVASEQLFPKVDGNLVNKNLVARFDGFTAFRIRNRGIWMRPTWFVFENARVATSREGVSLVTSGGLDGNAPGVWGLLKNSTVVGVSKNNVDRWGPCGDQNRQEGPGCVDWNTQSTTLFEKGYPSPAWNFAGFYIYDGPARIHDVRFVNFRIDPRVDLLTTEDVTIQNAFTQYFNNQTAYEGDAALGWFQNNQSAYPVATEVKGLKWDGVDLRHQVFTEKVNFGNFDDGDKNTAVIDRDGSLTGFKTVTSTNGVAHDQYPISLNNLPFNAASNAVDECHAEGAQDKTSENRPTSLISPANYGTLEFEAFTLPDGVVPPPPPPNVTDSRRLTQLVTITRDVVDYTKHQTMQLHSRNNQGIWEPKVVSGLGYTITAQNADDPIYDDVRRPPGMPRLVSIGLTDVVKPEIKKGNEFYTRVGVCYTNTDGTYPAGDFEIRRGYRSWGGNGVDPNDEDLRKLFIYLDLAYQDQRCFNLAAQTPAILNDPVKGCPATGIYAASDRSSCPNGGTLTMDRNNLPVCSFAPTHVDQSQFARRTHQAGWHAGDLRQVVLRPKYRDAVFLCGAGPPEREGHVAAGELHRRRQRSVLSQPGRRDAAGELLHLPSGRLRVVFDQARREHALRSGQIAMRRVDGSDGDLCGEARVRAAHADRRQQARVPGPRRVARPAAPRNAAPGWRDRGSQGRGDGVPASGTPVRWQGHESRLPGHGAAALVRHADRALETGRRRPAGIAACGALSHFGSKKGASRRPSCQPAQSQANYSAMPIGGASAVAGSAGAGGALPIASSSAAAFIDSRTRPFSSASMTFTRTIWPSFT